MPVDILENRRILKHILFLHFGILGVCSFAINFAVMIAFSSLGISASETTFLPIIVLYAFLVGLFYGARSKNLPIQFSKRYVPVLFPLPVTALLWAFCNLVSGGFYGHGIWGLLVWLKPGLIPVSFVVTLFSPELIFIMVILIFVQELSLLIGFILGERRNSLRAEGSLPYPLFVATAAVAVVGISAGTSVQVWRSSRVIPVESYGFEYAGGLSSVDLYPYTVTNPRNILPKLSEPSDFCIASLTNMPVLDGAEAAFPVYSAFANACYHKEVLEKQQSEKMGIEVVSFTNTIYAFERLLNGEVDIFFGAAPSSSQLELAAQKGISLKITPIAKEAFIFVVSEKNPVDGLTSGQIRDIYSGKIRNWRELGGNNKRIMAFQRPENSGSQTVMSYFMGDEKLIDPLKEEISGPMSGLYEQVADYRGQAEGIGYSFRFYAQMAGKEGYKILTLDNVAPAKENIASGTYPVIGSLYAITREVNEKETVDAFVNWMTGFQGQELIEKVGYVPN